MHYIDDTSEIITPTLIRLSWPTINTNCYVRFSVTLIWRSSRTIWNFSNIIWSWQSLAVRYATHPIWTRNFTMVSMQIPSRASLYLSTTNFRTSYNCVVPVKSTLRRKLSQLYVRIAVLLSSDHEHWTCPRRVVMTRVLGRWYWPKNRANAIGGISFYTFPEILGKFEIFELRDWIL